MRRAKCPLHEKGVNSKEGQELFRDVTRRSGFKGIKNANIYGEYQKCFPAMSCIVVGTESQGM